MTIAPCLRRKPIQWRLFRLTQIVVVPMQRQMMSRSTRAVIPALIK